MDYIVKRLLPGADLRQELCSLAIEQRLDAGAIVSLVGSLTVANIRLAGQSGGRTFPGPLEIVSATGTIESTGMHVHIALSDAKGTTYGGHLLDGCKINTTVEVVIAIVSGWRFNRSADPITGYPELNASKTARQ